jgi:hypothetical protein
MHKLSQEDARHIRITYYEHGPMTKRSAWPRPRTVECIAFMQFFLKVSQRAVVTSREAPKS